MTDAEIKKEVESLYEVIKNAKVRLAELRSVCKHEQIFEGDYGFERPPNILPARICSDCGIPIDYIPNSGPAIKWEFANDK